MESVEGALLEPQYYIQNRGRETNVIPNGGTLVETVANKSARQTFLPRETLEGRLWPILLAKEAANNFQILMMAMMLSGITVGSTHHLTQEDVPMRFPTSLPNTLRPHLLAKKWRTILQNPCKLPPLPRLHGIASKATANRKGEGSQEYRGRGMSWNKPVEERTNRLAELKSRTTWNVVQEDTGRR